MPTQNQIWHGLTDTTLVNTANNIGCYILKFNTQFGVYGSDTSAFTVQVHNPCDFPVFQTVSYGSKFEGNLVSGSLDKALITVNGP